VCYDVKYALRLCLGEDTHKAKTVYMKKSLQRACVYIYTVLKLYEEAVSMALKVPSSLVSNHSFCQGFVHDIFMHFQKSGIPIKNCFCNYKDILAAI